MAQPEGQEKPQKAEKKVKKEKAEKPAEKKVDENFRYIVRIMNTDIDGNRPMAMGIQNVKGVGPRVAAVVARRTGIKPSERMGNLSEAQTTAIEKMIANYPEFAPHWAVNRQNDVETGEDQHIFGVDLDIVRKDDINRMKMIRCYKGVRHEQGQKVRGQKTRSNGRTGLTMGVSRQKGQQPGAATATKK
ncbi:MAG: 30S ribosomal protein S13 [Methanomassiliicoccus sp.]|nr:30S ribosomal protein S13 [Methanomassiliicoccus sp.]